MRTFPLGFVAISALLLTACASQNTNPSPVAPASESSSVAATGNAVTIAHFQFSPQSITVKAGTTVTWTNNDSVSHTVTGDNGGPGSSGLSNGQSYSYTFTTPGTYTYHCTIHPMMKGTVVVTQ